MTFIFKRNFDNVINFNKTKQVEMIKLSFKKLKKSQNKTKIISKIVETLFTGSSKVVLS